jgi:hypothetical protein
LKKWDHSEKKIRELIQNPWWLDPKMDFSKILSSIFRIEFQNHVNEMASNSTALKIFFISISTFTTFISTFTHP